MKLDALSVCKGANPFLSSSIQSRGVSEGSGWRCSSPAKSKSSSQPKVQVETVQSRSYEEESFDPGGGGVFVEGHGGELWESPRSANHQILLCLFPFLLSLLQILSHVESLKGSAGDVPVRPEVRAPAGLKSKMMKKRLSFYFKSRKTVKEIFWKRLIPVKTAKSLSRRRMTSSPESSWKHLLLERVTRGPALLVFVPLLTEKVGLWSGRKGRATNHQRRKHQQFKFSSTFGFQVRPGSTRTAFVRELQNLEKVIVAFISIPLSKSSKQTPLL